MKLVPTGKQILNEPTWRGQNMHYQVANSGRSREQLRPHAPSRTPTGSGAVLGRSDLASHLKLSARSVDRFIARHRLRNGVGRRVLVCLETYAWCLVKLRRQSTRSMSPVPPVPGNTPAPVPIQPGEELLLVAKSDGFGQLAEVLENIAPGCRVRALDEWPTGHWSWSMLQAAEAMAGVREAVAHRASRPEPAGDFTASRYLRQFLHEVQGTGRTLDAAILTRCLRRLPVRERRLLLEALSEDAVASARADSDAPLAYAREPVLTEEEFAREVRRTVATARRWRVEGTGPVFLRIERAVRYSRVDVNHWLGEPPVR